MTPEDKAVTRRRTKLKGKRGVKYEDGWVEFLDKKTAKKVARALNNTKMGGKKGNYYHDDIWNIKYLKGFKWNHLTEKIAHEKQVRHQVIRNEMTEAKQESRYACIYTRFQALAVFLVYVLFYMHLSTVQVFTSNT